VRDVDQIIGVTTSFHRVDMAKRSVGVGSAASTAGLLFEIDTVAVLPEK
jgi:hypothetical protein